MAEDPTEIDRDSLLADFGKHFTELLAEYGLTQSDVAKLCDVDRQTINKMGGGKLNPSIVYVKYISNRTGIPTSRMLETLDSKPYELTMPMAAEEQLIYKAGKRKK